MVDNKNVEDEYQYPNEESFGDLAEGAASEVDEETPVQKQMPRQNALGFVKKHWDKNPRVIIVLVIVVILLIALKFMTAGAKAAQPSPVTAPVINPVPVVQKPVVAQPSPKVTAALSQLNKSSSLDQQSVASLQAEVAGLKSAMTSLAQEQSSLGQNVTKLSQSVNSLATVEEDSLKSTKAVMAAKPVGYTLRAIVPGRAWIDGSDNSAMSVAVGSRIPGFGQVIKILPNKGLVVTSEGKMIEFSGSQG